MSLLPPEKVGKLQDGVARQSEELARLSVLRVVRQGVPLGCSGSGLHALPQERRRSGGRRPDVRGHRSVRRGRWLDELADELRNERIVPSRSAACYIPKPDGKQRPLGIPCISDRVVQMAAVLVLEPIFEADLQPEQYAYRPERSALDAVRQVERLVRAGHTEVVDADLSWVFRQHPSSRSC